MDCQPLRFYDGGTDAEPSDERRPPLIVLERTLEMAEQRFRMQRRLAYRDREYGVLLVPADLGGFETDLASVPAVFGWLVPRSGNHLPAALLHDGLASAPGEPASYVSVEGHVLDRVEANRVFRDAMADTGTGFVRRWLMWSAVTTWTMLDGHGTRWTRAERLRRRLTAVATLALITALGVLGTLDLLDAWDGVPWMPEGGWVLELVTGAIGAALIPFALGLTWGRFRVAGVVVGVALGLLLHVTAAVAVLTGLYLLAERIAARLTSPGTSVHSTGA